MVEVLEAVSLVAGLALIPIGLIVMCRRTWRARRERFLVGRAHLSDAEFLAMVGVPGPEAALLPAIRRSIADMCEVPPEAIHPSDDTSLLNRLMFWDDGWDPGGFAMRMDEEIDRPLTESGWEMPIPNFVPDPRPSRGGPGPRDFGAWASGIAATLHEAGIRVEKPARPKSSGTFDPWLDVV